MGRELKRVSLDFKWLVNQIWKGYYHPFRALKCNSCDGTGMSPEYKKLSDDWYGFERPKNKWCNKITQDEVQALVDAGRLMGFTRVPITEEQKAIVEEKIKNGGNSRLPENNGYIPTAEEVNKWAETGFGHDAINQCICVEQRAKRLGIENELCEYCQGEGRFYATENIKKMSEEWESIEPPKGEGYQIWETVSEGSPISPVFDTPEKLAKYMSEHKWGADHGTPYETWLSFIKDYGWAPSGIIKNGKSMSGVESIQQ
jgi:hypothetical protein